MDAVEHGETFTVTRDGREIAELAPRHVRRFVARHDFAAASRTAPHVDLVRFRAEQGEAFDLDDPYAR
ncbi:hypothetical protein CCO02nite_14420 [Cellulomonas composti]|uniref:Prevent-host-death protein n=2 Tax=Cellulomonas composti TaxID=266130 RepID=A0A511J9X7_9CELL|nr:hypothetical protein CCO02nite_14420 [Cellulomonas composti]